MEYNIPFSLQKNSKKTKEIKAIIYNKDIF